MAPYRDDRFVQLRGGVISQDLSDQGDPRLRRDIGQSDQAGVGSAPNVKQSSEVRVDGDQDAAVIRRPAQQGEVTRIRSERSGLDDIVAFRPEPVGE